MTDEVTNTTQDQNATAASLNALKSAAATMRSRADLLKGIVVKFDGTSGIYGTKEEPDLNGKKFIGVVPNLVHGMMKWKKGGKPISHLGRVIHGYQPPPRHTLDERDEDDWPDDRDPWQPVHYLPLIDPESGAEYVYTTQSQGGRDAIANLLDAFVDNNNLNPADAGMIELNADSYLNQNYHRRIHIPQFDIVGWVTPPPNAQIAPPPSAANNQPLIEQAAEKTAEEADEGGEFGSKSKKRTLANDMDDSILF